MTKKTLSILFFLSFFIYTSCIKDDLDDCPSTRIVFSYLADGKEEVIDEYIQSAKLFIYDADGALYRVLSLSSQELHNPNGVNLPLPNGEYTLVVWGNAETQTSFIEEKNIETGRLHALGYTITTPQQSQISTNDALYWAKKTIKTNRNNPQNELVRFYSAHIHFNVYLSGFKTDLELDVTHLMPQYDFNMNPTQPFNITYNPSLSWVKQKEESLRMASFDVLRFNNKNDIMVEVRFADSTTKPIVVDVEQFIAKNYSSLILENTQEVTIDILIQKTDLSVVVTVPKWDVLPTIPEIS